MKTLLDETIFQSIRQRIENLQATSERQWGKMDAAQMLAHCNIPLETAIGVTPFKEESNFLSKTLIRWVVANSVKKGMFAKNSPTVPSFVVSDERDFEREKNRLLKNVDMFYQKAVADDLAPRHPAFGAYTREEWAGLQYTHLNHHLTQFSV